jgi:uncharacterized membrane protein AbrB (regulator of aidB expression)
MKNAICVLAIGLAGAVVASLLGIPAAWIIGPMLALSILTLVGVGSRAPRAYGEVGKLLLGTFIGAGSIGGLLSNWAIYCCQQLQRRWQ